MIDNVFKVIDNIVFRKDLFVINYLEIIVQDQVPKFIGRIGGPMSQCDEMT
jgi:hypothetical protein